MSYKQQIKDLSDEILDEVITFRRFLHQHPELSFQEENTSAYVAGKLKDWDIPYKENVGGYGVVGIIEGNDVNGKTIALRADMDALPIQEENDVDYASCNPGVMHACGHDVHTASLLGTAYVLNKLKNRFPGRIKLIFQPAEERLPGGASLMIKAGVLQNPEPQVILGQHVHPPLEVGKVGFRPGQYMASSDELFLTVKGKGGHGAMPHNGVDTTLVAAHIIVAMQQIISRRSDATIPSVLTLGKIYSDGGSTNIIPGTVHIEGTFRAMDEKWRYHAHELIRDTAIYTARALGASVDVDIRVGYPFLYNDPETTHNMRSRAVSFLGEDQVVDLPIRMTAEDFSYYSHEIKACFYRLGISDPDSSIPRQLHTPTFDVDERCLRTSVGLMTYLAIAELTGSQ